MRKYLWIGLCLASPAFAAPVVEIVSRTLPTLPREAYALPPASVHTCSATVTIDANGFPKAVEVTGCDPMFVRPTKDALMLWRWRVRAYDEAIPATLETAVDMPFRVPEMPAQRTSHIIQVPVSDGTSNTAVQVNGSTSDITLEEALASGMLIDHPLAALHVPLRRACTVFVTFDSSGSPLNVSGGDCAPDVAGDVVPGLWRWRAVAGTSNSRRVRVLLSPE